jgi:parvulin-like peptidyl-prolyl isomerase
MSGRKWTLRVLSGAAALAFGVGQTTAQSLSGGSKPAAVVNGEVITRADLDAALRQAGPAMAHLTEAERKQLPMKALGVLIDQALLRQFLTRNHVQVDAGEVNLKMAELEHALAGQGQTLQDFCRESRQTVEQIRMGFADMLGWQAYARLHLKETDVEQFYKDNKDLFDRTTVRVSHILVRLPASMTASERARLRSRLEDMRRQILAGQLSFAEAARTHSQCPLADKNGDLGFITRRWMIEEPLARAAFSLQVGQVSDIIETEAGLHLVEVTDRKPGPPSDYAREKYQVADAYLEDLRFTILEQQRKAAKIEIYLKPR